MEEQKEVKILNVLRYTMASLWIALAIYMFVVHGKEMKEPGIFGKLQIVSSILFVALVWKDRKNQKHISMDMRRITIAMMFFVTALLFMLFYMIEIKGWS